MTAHAKQATKAKFPRPLVCSLLETVHLRDGSHSERHIHLSGINFELKAKWTGLFAYRGLFGLVQC